MRYYDFILFTCIMLDQCPIPWENISSNVTFEYSISGPRLIYNHFSGLSPKGEIVSVCTSNGSWYPNPAEIDLCIVLNQGLSSTQIFTYFLFVICHYIIIGDCDNAGVTTMGSNEKYNHELLSK